jgi:hypothetical protein
MSEPAKPDLFALLLDQIREVVARGDSSSSVERRWPRSGERHAAHARTGGRHHRCGQGMALPPLQAATIRQATVEKEDPLQRSRAQTMAGVEKVALENGL